MREDGDQPADEPVGSVIERALEAYRLLGELGEQVADEWQYVNDLVTVHSADLRALVGPDPGRRLPAARVAGVDTAIEEVGLISDPHRAIDWLSTFPQIVRLAVGAPAGVPSVPSATSVTSSGG